MDARMPGSVDYHVSDSAVIIIMCHTVDKCPAKSTGRCAECTMSCNVKLKEITLAQRMKHFGFNGAGYTALLARENGMSSKELDQIHDEINKHLGLLFTLDSTNSVSKNKTQLFTTLLSIHAASLKEQHLARN